jgi:hypothetical protein
MCPLFLPGTLQTNMEGATIAWREALISGAARSPMRVPLPRRRVRAVTSAKGPRGTAAPDCGAVPLRPPRRPWAGRQ